MTQRKAYPIPETLPENLRCFFVAIPDDDLFLYQFMGAYRFFGTWVAWERDAAKRGKDAAALWRNAIEWTEEHMNCEFPDYTEILLQIVERLDNLTSVVENKDCSGQSEEDMAITINNSNCCGCCGSSSCTGGYVDDVELDDLDLPDPPDDEPPDDVNLYQKCSVAHYMTMQLRNTLIRLADETQSYPEFSAWWATLWGWLPLSIQLILFGVWVAVRSWLNRGVAWVTANFDPLYDNIVCAMYGAESAAAARIAVNAVLSNLPYPLNNAATSIASYLPWSVLFSEEMLDLPPGYTNRTCCGETPDPPPDPVPDPPTGYVWIPQQMEVTSTTNGATGNVSGNVLTVGGSSTNTTRPWVYVTGLASEAKLAAGVSGDIAAILHRVRVSSITPAANRIMLEQAWAVNSGDITIPVSGDYVAFVDDWQADLEELSVHYENVTWLTAAPAGNRCNVTRETNQTTNYSQNVRVETWLLIRLT